MDADEERVREHAERVDVRRRRDSPVRAELLGCHVDRRPDRLRALLARPFDREHFCDAEIEHLDERGPVLASRQEQVARLEIAMDDSGLVRPVESQRDVPEVTDRFFT